ncbi:MAG: TonB-dependent receptor domain-containing protein [Maricaulaceae bacterium]
MSGPIIKDKLFFFASYEEFRETDQLANGPIGSGAVNETDFLTIDTFNEIAQISIDNFGFDPGDFADVGTFSDNERKILLKLDWNINLNHRAALTFQRTTSSNIDQNEAPGLDSPSSFANFTADDPVVLTGQLVSNWTDNFNTLLRVSYRETRRQTESIITDTPFGETSLIDIVPVFDDAGGFDLAETVTLGPAADNLINIANSERLQLFARGEYTLANHRISFGYERDSQALFNLEVPTGSASFDFTPSDDFDPITGVGSSAIENFAAGIVDDVFISASITGDPLDLAADFTAVRHSLYIQDIWEPTPELQVLLGLRYERFAQDEAPEINPFFVDRFGFENNATLAGRDVFSPRFGLNYQPSYLPRTTFRTGLAVFAGSGPLTFLSAGFNINGITLGQALIDGADIEGPVDPNVIPQEALDALAALQDGLVEGEDGSTASLDPDFEIPRNLRFQFAIDQGFDLPYLGDDWNISLEVVHSEILQALQFVDLRLQEILPALPGAAAGIVRFNQIPSAVDTRFIGPIDTVQDRDDIIQDIQATNTSLGSSTVFSFDLNKNWDFGRFGEVLFNTGYAFTRSIDVSPANDTDSLQEVFETGAFDNINSPTPAPSIQAVPHNFNYSFTWQKRFWDGWRFQFNAFGNFRSGRATSLVIDDEFNISLGDLDNTEDGLLFIEGRQEEDFEQLVPGVSTTAAGRFIAPLPTGPDDPNFVFTNGLTFENTFGLLLEELPELAQFQGGLIPRNFLRAPNSHQLDLNAQLEIPVSRGQLILEGGIRNFLNLLDPRRGQIERFSIRENVFEAAFDVENEQIVIFSQENATGAGNGEGLIFNELEPSVGSIWRAQLGVRYRF